MAGQAWPSWLRNPGTSAAGAGAVAANVADEGGARATSGRDAGPNPATSTTVPGARVAGVSNLKRPKSVRTSIPPAAAWPVTTPLILAASGLPVAAVGTLGTAGADFFAPISCATCAIPFLGTSTDLIRTITGVPGDSAAPGLPAILMPEFDANTIAGTLAPTTIGSGCLTETGPAGAETSSAMRAPNGTAAAAGIANDAWGSGR